MRPFSPGNDARPLKEASAIVKLIVNPAHAETVIPRFPDPPKEQFWINKNWSEKDPWKNHALIRLQQALITRGVKKEDTKPFVMQIIQENGRMDPLYCKGDYGQSYGLGQWYKAGSNACARLQKEAAKKPDGSIDWDAEMTRQLRLLADNMRDKYVMYPGEIVKAVAAHNGPGRIRNGAEDSCRYVRQKWSCYWRDEVSKQEASLILQ